MEKEKNNLYLNNNIINDNLSNSNNNKKVNYLGNINKNECVVHEKNNFINSDKEIYNSSNNLLIYI